MAERQRYCAVCSNRTRTLHMLPRDPELKEKWLEIIFGYIPKRYSSKLTVCAQHFEETDFTNFVQFHSGFATKLLLKPEAVPSRLSTSALSTTSGTTVRFQHVSCQTDPPSLCNRGTQLSLGTLRHHVKSGGL
ncbi:putative LOC107396817-like protein [Xyrichtys novacula]|uniref:LOC107396817-like protein n=1 Tax=Xyrichtys novacula TaxID=13765 RepID=A0AAV1GFP3_XYRNO|nr:putative LOC107396817-like protein [Xyrichtys novacula]